MSLPPGSHQVVVPWMLVFRVPIEARSLCHSSILVSVADVPNWPVV